MLETFESKFSQDEWQTIRAGPASAGTLVMASSLSGLTGLLAETQAIALTLRELGLASQSAFVRELLHPTQAPAAAPREAFKSLEDARENLLNRVRQAAFLVDSRVAADDALEYKKLMMSVAERTAAAALEGGFLGLGGVQVSETERAVLEELRVQLRLQAAPGAL
jgi:hypothetical protein